MLGSRILGVWRWGRLGEGVWLGGKVRVRALRSNGGGRERGGRVKEGGGLEGRVFLALALREGCVRIPPMLLEER